MATTDLQNQPWKAKGSEKRDVVQAMFAEIAPSYDKLNGLMSFSLHHRWRAFAASKLQLNPGDAALDVCCGTGDFMTQLRKIVGPTGLVAGADFCLPMLEVAREKSVPMVSLGDACELPYQSGAFDGVTVGWGIRNVPDIDEAHREIARVLKPGGRFVSLDMAVPRNGFIRFGSNLVCQHILPWLGSLFGNKKAYTYLPESTTRFKTREELAESMRAAGFNEVGCKDLMFGNICVHWGVKG